MRLCWGKNGHKQVQQPPIRGALAENCPHDQPEVVGGSMNQAAFAYVFKSAQGQPAKVAAALAHGETSFHQFGPQTPQSLTFVAPAAPRVAMKFPAASFCRHASAAVALSAVPGCRW